ncbi:MAG TPA: hypothetical protein ENK98_03205 [Epsilonproteobacteria bacterium]|nr:hypothetical protein [Campylobacterota bacterium]
MKTGKLHRISWIEFLELKLHYGFEFGKMFKNKTERKERSATILKVYEKDYSQHMIAKVLGVSQQAVFGVIKRSRK